MTIESDGVITEVSREYEPRVMFERGDGEAGAAVPLLDDVTTAIAAAAARAHLIIPSNIPTTKES